MNMPIILSAGMQTVVITVNLTNDQLFENNEMFQGILTIISGERVSLSPGTANATIIEDEGMYMYTLCCISATHNYCTVEAKLKFLFRLYADNRFVPTDILRCGFWLLSQHVAIALITVVYSQFDWYLRGHVSNLGMHIFCK